MRPRSTPEGPSLLAVVRDALDNSDHGPLCQFGDCAACDACKALAGIENALQPVTAYIREHYFVTEIHDGDEQLVVMLWPAEIHSVLKATG